MPFVSTLAQRERNKRWRDNNPDYKPPREYGYSIEKRMFTRVKSRALKNSIPFEIDVSDIIIPEYCPVLNIKLVPKRGIGRGYYPDSPSLDRINPTLGYVKGNVRVISGRANLLKSDASLEELKLVYEDAIRIRC